MTQLKEENLKLKDELKCMQKDLLLSTKRIKKNRKEIKGLELFFKDYSLIMKHQVQGLYLEMNGFPPESSSQIEWVKLEDGEEKSIKEIGWNEQGLRKNEKGEELIQRTGGEVPRERMWVQFLGRRKEEMGRVEER